MSTEKGYVQTDEHRIAISKGKIGNTHARGHKGVALKKKVFHLSQNGEILKEWSSVKEAASDFEMSQTYMSLILSGKKKQPERIDGILITQTIGKPQRQVQQFDMAGNLIATHESVKAAAASVGTTKGNIIFACKGENCARGFRWKYTTEADSF